MSKRFITILSALIFIPIIFNQPIQTSTTHSISGTITMNAVGLKGVTVAIQGTAFSGVTDGLGNYYISGLPSGTSGTLVPTLVNYSFSPGNILFSNLQADLTVQDFTATQVSPIFYSISGMVTLNGTGLGGVLITFGTFTSTTAADGTYNIVNIPSGSKGRIVPALTGYAFTPTDITVSNLTANLVNENFTAIPVYTISGKVTDVTTLLPVGGVTVNIGSFSAVSSATTGAYTIRNIPAGTSGILTPSLTGETFAPSSITITNVQTDIHSQDFVSTP